MTSLGDARRLCRGTLQMKQVQERDLQAISGQDARLLSQFTALTAQRDAIVALIESSKLSRLASDMTSLRGEMRATALLRQQIRDIEVQLTTLAESREQLATDRELTEQEWRRWWRKETKYTRMAKTLRSDARKRVVRFEACEFEERQSWIA